MLEIQRIRAEKDALVKGLLKRNIQAEATLDEILAKDQAWRSAKTEMDTIAAEMNQLARTIGELFKTGKQAEAASLKERTAGLKVQEASLKTTVDGLESEITKLLYTLPNVPNELVPSGRDANDNETVYEQGSAPVFGFDALPHWDLAKKYNLIDFELGVKVTGAGFPFYRGKGAKLQRALIQFFLEEASKVGYEEIQAPLMALESIVDILMPRVIWMITRFKS